MQNASLDYDVVICGAGPVGLTAALKLAVNGVKCLILEKRDSLNVASKASTFHPPTLEILEEFGLLDVMLDLGCKADRIAYLRAEGGSIAEFRQPEALGADTTVPYRIHLEQSAITPHLLQRALDTGLVDIRYDAGVQDVGNDGVVAWAKTVAGDVIRARFMLGADGAQSSVREAIGVAKTGYQYPGRVLRLMVDKSAKTLMPELAPVTYIYSETQKSVSLLEMPDCWRIIIRVPEGLGDEDVKNPEWYGPIVQEFLPKLSGNIEIQGTDVYGASKMIVEENRAGRIGLIGDAVHLTNTKGGMNMNCGFHDAYAVASSIVADLAQQDHSMSAFTEALEERLRIARDVLLPRTDKNVTGKQDWLDFIAAAAADPKQARSYLLTSSMLDMAPARISQTSE